MAFAFNLYRQLCAGKMAIFSFTPTVYLSPSRCPMPAHAMKLKHKCARRCTLHYPRPAWHLVFNALQQALADREKNKNNPNETNFRLNVVNALWGQQGYTFLPAYLDLLVQNYGAGMRLLTP